MSKTQQAALEEEGHAAPEEAAPDPPTCGACRYWLHRPHLNGLDRKGVCRRFPPNGGVGLRPGEYSLTNAGGWCGEHAGLA